MPKLVAFTTTIDVPMKRFIPTSIRLLTVLATTLGLSSAMPCASRAQGIEWDTLNLAPIAAKHIGVSPSTVHWPTLTIWRDTVWAIQCLYRLTDDASGEHFVLESTDAGLTWQTLSRIPESELGKSSPDFRSMFYTPRGTLVALDFGKYYQFDRGLQRWVRTWLGIPDELAHGSRPEIVEDAEDLILKIKDRALISKDDGLTFQEYSGQFDGRLPDGTQFRFGYRLRPGWSIPDFRLPETELGRILTPMSIPFWAEPVGLAIQAPFIGDDDATCWDRIEGAFDYGTKMTPNGYLIDVSSSHDGVFISADYGKSIDEVHPAGTNLKHYTFVKNIGGKNVFLMGMNYEIYPIRGDIMPATLRWPQDSAVNRHRSVTLVCPAELAGDVRVQVATSASFDDLLVDSTIARRYAKITDLKPYTTYFWRFSHRLSPTESWGSWSTTWSFTTGSLVVWRHIGSRPTARSTRSQTIRLWNGDFVQTAPANNAVFVSQNKGKTWDSILVIPSEQPVSHIWESPGKRVIMRAGNSLYSIDVASRSIIWTTETPVFRQPVVDGQSMYGTALHQAYRSFDDGRSWRLLRSWNEFITGVDMDSHGRVLFGTQYQSVMVGNQYGPLSMEWAGGLRRFDPRDGVMEQVTPNYLKDSTQFIPAYRGMRFADDGLLYSIGNVRSEIDFAILVSTDEGITWQPLPDSLAPFSPSLQTFLLNDANSQLIAWTPQYVIKRKLNGQWEDLAAELVSGLFPNDLGSLESLSRMSEGTLIANNRFYVDYDPANDAIRPQPLQNFASDEPIAFSWAPIPNAQSYTLEIPTSDLQLNTSTPNFVADGLVPPGSHTWRVRALLRDGRTSKWTVMRSFSVGIRTSIHDASGFDVPSRSNSTVLTRSSLLASLNGNPVDAVDVLGRPIQHLESVPLPQLIFLREGTITRKILLVE